ncbi:MAG TPA: universal stress protein [Candidatus Tectomicrobia bacterium]|nr:universal stress protein [Candidatus Tectomicrobia bacterium]
MFRRMLVPVDGSPQANRILPYASSWASRLHIPILLLSIVDLRVASSVRGQGDVEHQLQQAVDRLHREGVQAAVAITAGRPAEEILGVADSQGCDLIVLSTSTKQGIGQGILGRVTDKVFHTSQLPLLLIPPLPVEPSISAPPVPTTLMVPLDGSPLAEAALPFAEELAPKLSAKVMLVRAVPFAGAIVDEKTPPSGEVEARGYLARLTQRLRLEGLTVQSQTLDGPPVELILELARRTPHSLVLLTTHGRSAFARWFVGSVAEGIVRAASIPVLVIPRQHSRRYAARVSELIAQAPLFAALSPEDLEHIAETARIRTYQRGEVIVHEGETATECFLIASGLVEVVKGEESSHPTVLGRLKAGEFFGEMAVIDDHPRSASVRAIEETECVAIARTEFLEALQRRPQIAVQMLPVLVHRLRQADERAAE